LQKSNENQTIMPSALFTELTKLEEAILSGGAVGDINTNINTNINTAVAINNAVLSSNTVQNAAAVANSGDRVGISSTQVGVIRRRPR
jgi:hypothetical protein